MNERKGSPADARSPDSESEEERLRFAMSCAPVFLWEWELATNRVVTLQDEWGLGDGSGGDLFQWVHAEDLERVREAAARIAAGENLEAVDFRLVPPGGRERCCIFRARRRTGADGQPTHLCGMLADVTDRMLAARAAAEEANRAKDEFLAMLSHELRTPLTPASTLVQMLARDPTLAPEHRAIVAEVGTHISTEKRLIEDLLAFERLVRDAVELSRVAVDVHDLARHALSVCSSLIQMKRLSVVESFTASESFVHGDVLRLRQVLWNLIQNAVKFTPQQGKIVVRTANPQPGVLVVEVEDNGSGIRPEMLRKIFDRFERGGRRPDTVGGLGLGLAISRKLVELHGGTLTAASPGRGRGATFTVRLATTSRAAAEARTRIPEPPSPAPAGVDRPLKILFLEDHSPTAKAITRLLQSHGHTVRVAGGLTAGERAVEAERFDLLLCDLQLPEGSGLDFLPRVRHHLLRWAGGGAEAPAIVLSGFGREADTARSLAAGYAEHLVKPVEESEFLAAIRRVTATREN